jgi:glycosyltransferase involved in cell wall biosynthesis
MRIAHLVTGGELAGGQAIALRLARVARAAGHDALFLSPTSGEFLSTAASDGFRTELVDVTRTSRLRGTVQLRSILRRLRVDLLHTHVHVAASILGRAAAHAAGTPVVAHLHIENHFRPQRIRRAPLVALDNATARLCARILAVSEDTRRAFQRQGFPPRLMETVHNGVDTEALEAAPPPGIRRELDIPADAVALCHIGRVSPVKGQRELLEALARLTPRRPEVRVVLVGEDVEAGGAYRAELERLAASLGLGEIVRFAGFRPEAAAALKEMDVLVLPSWIEGLPLVVLEAMAQAKPVVATAVGGTPEAVIDGETGLLVPPRDRVALMEALERVLDDDPLRRRLGEAGQARCRAHFEAAAMDRRVLEVYDEVAAGH